MIEFCTPPVKTARNRWRRNSWSCIIRIETVYIVHINRLALKLMMNQLGFLSINVCQNHHANSTLNTNGGKSSVFIYQIHQSNMNMIRDKKIFANVIRRRKIFKIQAARLRISEFYLHLGWIGEDHLFNQFLNMRGSKEKNGLSATGTENLISEAKNPKNGVFISCFGNVG